MKSTDKFEKSRLKKFSYILKNMTPSSSQNNLKYKERLMNLDLNSIKEINDVKKNYINTERKIDNTNRFSLQHKFKDLLKNFKDKKISPSYKNKDVFKNKENFFFDHFFLKNSEVFFQKSPHHLNYEKTKKKQINLKDEIFFFSFDDNNNLIFFCDIFFKLISNNLMLLSSSLTNHKILQKIIGFYLNENIENFFFFCQNFKLKKILKKSIIFHIIVIIALFTVFKDKKETISEIHSFFIIIKKILFITKLFFVTEILNNKDEEKIEIVKKKFNIEKMKNKNNNNEKINKIENLFIQLKNLFKIIKNNFPSNISIIVDKTIKENSEINIKRIINKLYNYLAFYSFQQNEERVDSEKKEKINTKKELKINFEKPQLKKEENLGLSTIKSCGNKILIERSNNCSEKDRRIGFYSQVRIKEKDNSNGNKSVKINKKIQLVNINEKNTLGEILDKKLENEIRKKINEKAYFNFEKVKNEKIKNSDIKKIETIKERIFKIKEKQSREKYEKNKKQISEKRESLKKFTLVLDLDETLIHYDLDSSTIYRRPYLNEFLTTLSKYYELIIFTAGKKDYADEVINQIDSHNLIKSRLYRKDTDLVNGVNIKNLQKIGRDLNSVIIVDNIKENFSLQKDNGILIKSFYGNQNDQGLKKLTPILEDIALGNPDDIRELLRNKRKILAEIQ